MKGIFFKFTQWLCRILSWLERAKLAVFTILVTAVTLYISLGLVQSEQSLRVGGLFLQLLGLLAAAIGIRDTLKSVRRWFGSFPSFRTKVAEGGSAAEVLVSATGGGSRRADGLDHSLESRLAAVEENFLELRDRFDSAEAKLGRELSMLMQKISDEQTLRENEDRELLKNIKDGSHLAAAGVVWLAFGLVMSTAPSELLCLVQ